MAALLELPKKDSDDLTDAIEVLLGPAIRSRNVHQIGWWVTDAYLQGMRRFEVIDMERGALDVAYEEDDGNVHMRWEEPLTSIQTEVGRLSRLDLSPWARKQANSLESLRGASIAQVLLDQQNSMIDSDKMDQNFLTGLVLYGTYGRAAWRDETSESPLAIVPELIPPWELLGIPAGYSNPTDLRAVWRTRLFPLGQLIKMPGIKLPKDEGELEIIDMPYGSHLSVAGSGFSVGSGSVAKMFDESPSGEQQRVSDGLKRRKILPGTRTEKMVRLREGYILGPQGDKVARYIARAGRAVVSDLPYLDDGIVVPMPIGIAHYQSTNHFYGRSFAGKIIPFALEMEALLEQLMENMADFNRFGYTMIPMDRGIDMEQFKATEEPGAILYEPDITSGKSGVEQLLPATATDIPGRTFQFGLSLLDRITAQGPMFASAAPGRADSGEAFRELLESGSTHLVPVAKSLNSALRTVFRYQLHEIRQRFTEEDQLGAGLALTKIDNSIAGLVIDSKTGKVKLKPDQLPDPFEVELSIRSQDPVSRDRRRGEAPTLVQQGLLSPLEFIIMNYKEGWDYPIGNRAVWENYVKAVMINLIMFNDGDTPGELPGAIPDAGFLGVYFHAAADKPEVHLQAIEDFIAGPEFALASKAVQDAFTERVSLLREVLGGKGILSDEAPTIDEAAVQSSLTRQGPQQGGQSGAPNV